MVKLAKFCNIFAKCYHEKNLYFIQIVDKIIQFLLNINIIILIEKEIKFTQFHFLHEYLLQCNIIMHGCNSKDIFKFPIWNRHYNISTGNFHDTELNINDN